MHLTLTYVHLLQVASDYLLVAEDINKGSVYRASLWEHSSRRAFFEIFLFKFESRNSNKVEDRLAKLAISMLLGRNTWLLEPPDDVSSFPIKREK